MIDARSALEKKWKRKGIVGYFLFGNDVYNIIPR